MVDIFCGYGDFFYGTSFLSHKQKMKTLYTKHIQTWIIAFGLSLANTLCASQTLKEIRTIDKTLNIQTIFKVKVTEYDEVLSLPIVPKSAARQELIHDALASFLSSMSAQDYDWWLSLWDAESRKQLEKNLAESGRNKENLVASWKGMGKEKPFVVSRRADYNRRGLQYAIFGYKIAGLNARLQDQKGNVLSDEVIKSVDQLIVFKKVGARWEATQDLASDFVLHYIEKLWDKNSTQVSEIKNMN